MMHANSRAPPPRGAVVRSDASGLHCDPDAEEMLRSFWERCGDGAPPPPELRGLAEAAEGGPAGVRRSLLLEQPGERLRIEVTALGRGRARFHLWREALPGPLRVAGPEKAPAAGDGLTPRERQVAAMVAEGLRSREVAERLDIAPQTVKSHLKTIFDKLGVRNRVELARRLQAIR